MMKQRILAVWLIALLGLLVLAGCGSSADESDAAIQVEVTEDEEFVVYNLEFEAYQMEGGMITVTQDGVTDTFGGVGCSAQAGLTIRENLESRGYQLGDVTREGDTFEGWMMGTIVITVDEDGSESWDWQLTDRETLYSTEEVMEMVMPAEHVFFLAKWAGIDAADYEVG